MIYRLNCSSGNTIGVEEFISYSEIDDSGLWRRYLEIRADGKALRYSRNHIQDNWGMLPDGKWVESEAIKPHCGVNVAISKELFEAAWQCARCVNELG